MNIKAWAILTTGLADGYELTKSPARVQAARENGQTVLPLIALPLQDDQQGCLVDYTVKWCSAKSDICYENGFVTT